MTRPILLRIGATLLGLAPGLAADQLTISPSNPRQLDNSTLQFAARLGRADLTKVVMWTSSDPGVATVARGGTATLLSVGTANITASLGALRVSTTLSVTTATSPVFSSQPTDTNVGAVISGGVGGVAVRILDNLGDPLPNQSVTLGIGDNPPRTGVLTGTLTRRTDVAGTARFPDLRIDWLGTGYTLVAGTNPTSGPVSGTSAPFGELRVGDPCLGPESPACASGCADTDFDGLNDAWETAGGVDVNGDGVITDAVHDALLPGADPAVPDIYLKYDYMVAASHDHQPPARAWDQMRAMFAAHGIVLHVLAPARGIPEHRVTALDPDAKPNCTGTDVITMPQLRAQYFGNLRPAYHYMVFAHDSTTPNDGSLAAACPADALCAAKTPGGASGVADLPGDDAIISFGFNSDNDFPIGIEAWASAMMHELGHNFGLVHGSLAHPDNGPAKCQNYSPNYISVMNYDYELSTLVPATVPGALSPISCAADADCGPPTISSGRCANPNACFCTDDLGDGNNVCYRPDYAGDQLLNLNETALDEHTGVGGPATLDDIVWYYAGLAGTLPGASNRSPIDWNNDGTISDLTGCVGIECPNINNSPFHSNDQMDMVPDWLQVDGRFVNLNLQFQCTDGYLNDGPESVTTSPAGRASVASFNEPSEISLDWARRHHRLHPPRPVSISVAPGCSSDVKPVASGQPGMVRVAVLGTDRLDVTDVDTSSLSFHGASPVGVSLLDVNGDGIQDLLALFDASTARLHPQAAVGRLTGWFKSGQAFWGEEKIRIVTNLAREDATCR